MPDRYTKYRLIVSIDSSIKKITFYHLEGEKNVYEYTGRKAFAVSRRCRQLWLKGRAFPDFTRGITWGIDPVGTWEILPIR
jgi:hypothetical protein